MYRLRVLIFIIGAGLMVTGTCYLQYRAELREAEIARLQLEIESLTRSYESKIEDLTRSYRDTALELKETQEKVLLLNRELEEALEQMEAVEKRNRYLEQVLFNQTRTYRTAVAMKGSTMPVLTVSNFTATQYERAWRRLGAHGLVGTGAALVRAEELYGVNSLVLAAIAYHESGGGMSRIAREKNNLFGLGAADADPFRYALSFNTKADSIYFTAGLLRNSYLSRWGRHYRGDNLVAVGTSYAADPQWAAKISRCMALIARAAIPEGR